jgi:DNA repair protein SbcC/Rad50
MLEYLKLRNFQRYKKFELVFDPQITSIVGPSDSGKTALIRALRLVFTGEPRGNAYITHGETRMEAEVGLDGHVIQRVRDKKQNNYNLDGMNLDGANVPHPIAELANLHESAFQGQLDAPFWLSEKAAQVSEKLNEIVNLSVMDQAMEVAHKEVKSLKAQVSVSNDRLAQIVNSLNTLEPYLEREADIDNLEVKEAQVIELETRKNKLTLLVEQLREHERIMAFDEQLADLDTLVAKGRSVQSLNTKQIALGILINRLIAIERQVQQPHLPLEKLQALSKKYAAIEHKRSRLLALTSQLRQAEEDIAVQQKQLAVIEARIPKRCPQCQQPLANESTSSASTSRTSTSTKNSQR